MSEKVALGTAPEPGSGRDAVHVAVIAMKNLLSRALVPGEWLANGIVDPYLREPVPQGGTFWLCLYPNTVTSLRHVWEHPAYPSEGPK